jgi:hypothetical protein
MKRSTARLGAVLAAATMGVSALAASAASADVPSFGRCPRAAPDVLECLVVKSTEGSITANGHTLPLPGNAVTIEGGIAQDPITGDITLVAPASGPTLTGKPVPVPGGLFGTNLPYGLNTVTATVEQAGPIAFDYNSFDITAPVRIKFANPLLGSGCAIGSAASPITLHLTLGTTAPPTPNLPVSGQIGTISVPPGTNFAVTGNTHVDNAFAVPAASGCGVIASTQVTQLINRNLGLPSAAGHNSASLSDGFYDAPASS